MLKNYWKIAIRNLLRNKTFSFINIVGLAVGMASAILIILWIRHEWSYDRFYAKGDRLYELMTSDVSDGKLRTSQSTPEIMAPAIQRDCPEVEAVARLGWNNKSLFDYKDKNIKAYGAPADPAILTMFSLPLLEGDPVTALNDPHSLVVTEDMAHKLFGSEEPMGKIVRIDNQQRFTVTGVVKNLPDNSQINFEFLNSYLFKSSMHYIDSDWTDVSNRAFVLLRPHASLSSTNARLLGMIPAYSNQKAKSRAFLYPMDRTHLYGEFENGKPVGGRIVTVRIFGFSALLILLIACINFMNLSTARSEKRAKEVGVRKVIGARKRSLVLQFLMESLLIAMIAGVLALLIVELSLPAFSQLTRKHLAIDYGNVYVWLGGMGFLLVTGLLAGSYPAFFLSAFSPVAVLKGTFRRVHALVTPRKMLVVTQFTAAILFIVCTLIIERQVQYAQERKVGYDRQNLIYFHIEGEIGKHYDAIRDELLHSGAVLAMSQTLSPLTQMWSYGMDLRWQGMVPNSHISFSRSTTDGGIVKAAGLSLAAGRDIDIRQYPSDSTACLINESAAKAMGMSQVLGQEIYDEPVSWHVVGILKDFIVESPYEPVRPLIIKGPRYDRGVIHLKMNGANPTSQNLATIGKVLKQYNPAYPFEYHFLDDEYAKKFGDERLIGTLSGLFTLLTIFISCLGLFGLAAYMAESRNKEIGIRKVLGASVSGIALLLSSGFMRLVLISVLIATPIAWWAMHRWLAGYSYRIHLSAWYFVLAGLGAMGVALFAVCSQAMRAALSNPVRSLRSE